MEANKENIRRVKTTKIPLPVQPLPALPKHLVQSSAKMGKENNERYPLKTLASEENLMLPGPSRKFKAEREFKIDSRHVTKRRKDENLDWDFQVFKDESTRGENVGILSDEEGKNTANYYAENRRRKSADETRVATPALRTLEPNRVRNIKRSLKRPHSRELQGLSPLASEQKKCDERAKRRLQFHEPMQEKLQSFDYPQSVAGKWIKLNLQDLMTNIGTVKKAYANSLCRDYGSDIFSYLHTVERRADTPKISNTLRGCVINWLMKINGADGNPATVQTAIWYLDSILSLRVVLVENLQLFGAACYWIAHKVHGPGLAASRLVKCSNNAFSISDLQSAEKEILKKLKFPPQPVVPQEFITYLSWWCNNSHPGEIEVAATFLCMSGLLVDKKLCMESPSVLGAAAVRTALVLLKKKGLILHLQSCPVFQAAATKTTNMEGVCSSLRRAIRTVGSSSYEFKTPFQHYGTLCAMLPGGAELHSA